MPKHILEIGKRVSEFRVILPKVEQARLSSRTVLGRNDDLAAKAIIAFWDDVHQNLDSLEALGLRGIYRAVLEEPRSKVEALEAVIAGKLHRSNFKGNESNVLPLSILKQRLGAREQTWPVGIRRSSI